MVAASRDAIRQDLVCISRGRTDAGAKSRLFKKAIGRQLRVASRTPHLSPAALTYIKGSWRIDFVLRAFPACRGAKIGIALAS
jgi:hypothetical protein